MILGLDISTSITGVTVLDDDGKIVLNEAWDLRKYKEFFQKAEVVKNKIWEVEDAFHVDSVYIEQSLQSFRSGFSSARTLSTLSRFNGVVSWLCYDILKVTPEYIAATSARKKAGIVVPRGTKAKECVIRHVIDNVPDVTITYTRFGNVKPECYDKADSWVIAAAGHTACKTKS